MSQKVSVRFHGAVRGNQIIHYIETLKKGKA